MREKLAYSLNNRQINSINTIRFLAAFQVMWGHMIEHLNVNASTGGVIETISRILQYFNGVPLFFFLSSYLIKFSVERSKDTKEYVKKRFWRIYPELWIGVIIEILTILLFYNKSIDWLKLGIFAVTQGTILQFWTPEFLRGYGCGTPNGSLWTICVTVQFYILIWLTRQFWRKWRLNFWFIVIGLFMMVGACTGIIEKWVPSIIYKLYCQTIIQYFWIFLLGIATAEYAEKLLPVLKKFWWLEIAIFIVWKLIGIDVYARNFPVFMTMISCFGCLGIAYRFPKLNLKIDISYAIFIYHMIFVNIMISIGWTEIRGLIVVIVITFLVAYLSTIVIGSWRIRKRY